jgi:hypothetical protein
MKLTSSQILVYIIFIICIVLISYYYTNQYKYGTEGFGSEEDLIQDINTNLERLNITDDGIKTSILNYIKTFASFLDTYKKIEVPITVNNNGICSDWGSYNNNQYKNQKNNCIKIENDIKCLSNNSLASCSNYYNDGIINNLSNINVQTILDTVKYNIFTELNGINADINRKNDEIKKVLDDLILKTNLENQQKFFIDYNIKNIEDKKYLLNKNSIDFEKSQNEVNINKIEFQQNIILNKLSNNRMNLYYDIITWIILLLIIIGLMNFTFSETD